MIRPTKTFAKDPAPNSGRIDGVEIFRTGLWNGDKYSVKDLLDIVAANKDEGVGFQPPVKLGHSYGSDEPAYGWVENLRITFDDAKKTAARLIADFIDVPLEVITLVKERRFDSVSSEIFWNFKRDGKEFRRVLKAVALLGSETPGVGNLKPLHQTVAFTDEQWSATHAYTTQLKRKEGIMLKTLKECTARLAEIADLVKTENDPDALRGLYAEQATVTARHADLSKADDIPAADGADDSGVDPLEFKAMQDEMTALRQQVVDSGERERKANVEAKVKDLRVPALRDHVAALYDMASKAPTKVRFFTHDDAQGVRQYGEVDAVKVIDDLVERINKSTAKLFEQLGSAGDLGRDDEPAPTGDAGSAGVELARLTDVYLAKNPKIAYREAMQIVRDDPENAALKRAYAEGN